MRPDPTHLRSLDAFSAGQFRSVASLGIRAIHIGGDGPDQLAATLHGLKPAAPVVLVTDATPKARQGSDLLTALSAVVAAQRPLTTLVLPAGVHAGLAQAEALAGRLAGHELLLAVGSGSVTDLVKHARTLAAPSAVLISLPTATSVTAYTSALAVIAVDGVKRTLPSRPPEYVIADLPTLCAAPPSMTRAGFGDVLARSVSHADWWLAAELGMTEGYSELPGALLAAAEQTMVERAEQVAAAAPDGVRAVLEGLLLAGLAMSLANQTSPLSGWEHVISHYLDMTAVHQGRDYALHGEQVGVATLVTARAMERAWPALAPAALLAPLDGAGLARQAAAAFDPVDPSGAMTAEVQRDLAKKCAAWEAAEPARRSFVPRKLAGELDAALRHHARPADEVAAALRRAGCPTDFAAMSQPVSRDQAREALQRAHLVRSRWTFGDLLSTCGWLPAAAESLLA